jgi:hypothetical protein
MNRAGMWAGAAALLLLSPCLLAAGAMTAFGAGDGTCTAPVTTSSSAAASAAGGYGSWDQAQAGNATTIVSVGVRMKVPGYGWVIAVATAMQESGLRNLGDLGDRNDHDSLGLFQQRPSQGWGTPAQIMQPEYAAAQFYRHLLAVNGWQQMQLTAAAQAVQRSAYPDAYAKWQADAERLVTAVSGVAAGGARVGCSPTMSGSAEPVPRNSDGSWPAEGCIIRPDPTTGSGCVTPRLLHLVQQATAAGYPKPSCYRVDDHGEHPKGRACDWMMTSGGEASGAQKARGDAMAAWAVANVDRLGIKYVIWFRMIWTRARGWHAYNNPFGGNDPSGWHTNHVHISVE